jgi:hypothetical protein
MMQNSTAFPDDTAMSVIVWPADGKDMVFVRGGTFVMGSNDGSPHHQPEHRMHVADFYMDRTRSSRMRQTVLSPITTSVGATPGATIGTQKPVRTPKGRPTIRSFW